MSSHSSFLKIIQQVDTSWTLFLDRDGVINEERNKDYVKSIKEFFFLAHVKEALLILKEKFGNIIIVTNQRGVSLNLMTQKNLDDIHGYMQTELHKVGVNINLILASTSIHNDSFFRKPQAGMAFEAQKIIPSIDFSKSIMVGNSNGDLLFARNVRMYSVFLTTTKTLEEHQKENADLIIDSLWSFAKMFNF